MSIYSEKDLQVFNDNKEEIKKKLIDHENKILEPTFAERKRMEELVFDFLRKMKRKIYGGYAINRYIIEKNPEDGFYDLDNEIADIDFYSPDPIVDSIQIADLFLEKGFQNIKASEASHKETYTVFVEYIKVCDISYVPKNIYNRMPYFEIKGLNYVNPQFIMIDMLRIMTDPLTSGSFRWEKTIPRINLLQKYYPFMNPSKKLDFSIPKIMENIYFKNKDDNDTDKNSKFTYNLDDTDENNIQVILKYISKFMSDNEDFVLYGPNSYNYYLEQANSKKEKLPVNTYYAICFNYVEKTKDLFNSIKEKFDFMKDSFSLQEYTPFWTFLGYSSAICYKGYHLINISHYINRCVPTKKDENNIQIPSFDYNLLLFTIEGFRSRVNDNRVLQDMYNTMIYNLIEFKRDYFNKNKNKTILDDSPFQELIIECKGKTVDSMRETHLRRNEKAKKGKLIVWKYTPSPKKQEDKEKEKELNIIFKFSNSSGNLIRNTKNLKIK